MKDPLDQPLSTGEALHQEAARRAATAGTGGSPKALESALADISAEVTAEAIERMAREAKRRIDG